MSGTLDLEIVVASERGLHEEIRRGAHRWDPRLKLFLLAVVVALNTGLAIHRLSAALLGLGLLLVVWSRPALGRTLLFFLAPLFATAVAVLGFTIGFGRTPLLEIGGVTLFREGLIAGGGVALRVYCDVAWLVLTVVTTPFSAILQALRWWRMPAILVDTLALMYRYAFLLYEEFSRMHAAALTRGGRAGAWRSMKAVSHIAAQIFMRAFDRSSRIHAAMIARGGE